MPKRLKHILFAGFILAMLFCLFSFSASAFEYEGSVNDVDLSTFSVDIGGTTLPLPKYPDGSVTPFCNLSSTNYANYMTVEEAKEYGITLYSNLWLRSAECMAFARYVYAALYYKYPATATMDNYIASTINPAGSYAYIDVISSAWAGGSYTASEFASLIKSCYPGSFIRQGGHSMVIMAIFDDGLIVYDANGTYNYNEVDVRKYTWQGYINAYGKRAINALQIPSYYPGYTYSNGSTGGSALDYDLDITDSGLYKVSSSVTSYLNVRSAPYSTSSVVGKVYAEDELEVLGTYEGWAAVDYDGTVCWISMSYLELIQLNVVVDGYTLDTTTAGVYQIDSEYVGYLRVRDLPTTSSAHLDSYAHGTVVEVLGTYDGWAAIVYEDGYGWLSCDYLVAFTGTITVSFDANGGVCDTTSIEYSVGDVFGTMPVPTKDGATFIGWYSGDTLYDEGSSVPMEGITLTAKWSVQHFIDVPEDEWYREAVSYVFDNGIMQGTSDNTFEPSANLTRASAAQILYNLAGQPEVTTVTQAFPDVSADEWFYNAVTWCAENELVTGNEKGYFMPSDNITRQDFIVLIWRYATNYAQKDTSNQVSISTFPDSSSVSGYALDAMKWAVAEGIINGMGDGTLSPKGTANRAMIAKILMVYHQNYA